MNDSHTQISRPVRITGSLLVAFLMAWGITRAAGSRYDSQVAEIQKQALADQQRLGFDAIKNRKELFDKHPCPTISLAKIATAAPGETVDIAATGTFTQGTRFLFDYDEAEVVKESATAAGVSRLRVLGSGFLPAGAALARPAANSTYRATLRVSPNATFGFVRLHAFAPVSAGHTAAPALFIGGKNNWEVTAKNGWRVSLKMQGNGFTLNENKKQAEGRYTAEFFRSGEAKPFETREAVATFQDYQGNRNLTFSLQEMPNELEQMSAKMGELSTMSEKEQEKFMARFQELQMKMMENMQAMLADPAAANKKQAEFGCHTLQIRSGVDQGALLCGEKVGTVEVSGVRTLIAANRAPARK